MEREAIIKLLVKDERGMLQNGFSGDISNIFLKKKYIYYFQITQLSLFVTSNTVGNTNIFHALKLFDYY